MKGTIGHGHVWVKVSACVAARASAALCVVLLFVGVLFFCRRVFGVSRNFSVYVSLLFGLLLSVLRSASCASIVGFGVCTCMFMCLLGSV